MGLDRRTYAALVLVSCVALFVQGGVSSSLRAESTSRSELEAKIKEHIGARCAPALMDLMEEDPAAPAAQGYDETKAIADQVGKTEYVVAPGSGVTELTMPLLKSYLQTRPMVVLFYAKWSNANNKASLLLNKMSGSLASCQSAGILIGRIDTEVPGNQAFIHQLGIDAVPSFVFFPVGTRDAIVYQGTPSEKDFVAWLAEAAEQSKKAMEKAVDLAKKSQPNGVGGTDGTETGTLNGMLSYHNVFRMQHHISPMTWDNEISLYAQAWADKLRIEGCKKAYREGGSRTQDYGENIEVVCGKQATAGAVVQGWYNNGVSLYSYADGSCTGPSEKCNAFTQVVWAGSMAMGCGMATCDNQDTVWVCNYSPPGNTKGNFVMNVKDPSAVKP